MATTLNRSIVGKPVPRKEGPAKVTGQAQYIDDLTFPGMLYGATVRSTIPRGKITRIAYGEGTPWDEVVVVTANDIPGKNVVDLILEDQPYLADGIVNHPEEAIVLLAHPDKYVVEAARRNVQIEYDRLPAVLTLEDSLQNEITVWGADNVFKSFHVEKGNVDEVSAGAHLIIEDEYSTGAQEQLYIEPNGIIAVANPEDGVTIWGSMQCPYYIHKALIKLFDLPEDKIRVIQAETGGGFGGKEEFPSMIAGHAALLAWKSGRPVKLIYDRAEDMAVTTKRHPSKTRHKTAVSQDGKLLAMEIDFSIDGGAYATLSSVVLSRGTIHAAGPYACPNVRIDSRAVATNTPPHGAFRGFGAPQSIFALERHLDKVAKAVGLSPDELRRRNFIHLGESTATSQVIHENVDLEGLLDRTFELTDYHSKRERFASQNSGSKKKKGIGLVTFMHGAGFTGSGEVYLQSVVGMEGAKAGGVRVLAASTEIGQGTNTIFAQIAADALGIDYELVEIAVPDTGNVPNSGPTVASRTAMIVGTLVQSAAKGIKQTLMKTGLLGDHYTPEQFRASCGEFIRTHGARQ